MRRRLLALLVAAAVLAPSAHAAVPFNVRVTFANKSPRAGKRWEYAVFVTNGTGRGIRADVFPQVFVGRRLFDTLGSHYTLLGVVAQPYTWSPRLRGRSGVVLQVTVFAKGTKRVLRYPFRVR